MDSSDSDSYAGSATSIAADRDTGEARVVELIESAFDPLPLDRAIVVETQHSGLLNADAKDISQLKAQLDECAASSAENMLRMQALVKKIGANVEWLNARVKGLEAKAKAAIPIEYAQAESKVVFREDV